MSVFRPGWPGGRWCLRWACPPAWRWPSTTRDRPILWPSLRPVRATFETRIAGAETAGMFGLCQLNGFNQIEGRRGCRGKGKAQRSGHQRAGWSWEARAGLNGRQLEHGRVLAGDWPGAEAGTGASSQPGWLLGLLQGYQPGFTRRPGCSTRFRPRAKRRPTPTTIIPSSPGRRAACRG